MELVRLAIVGKGDTRPFAYPLLSVAKDAAKTCLITDDPCYRRLYPGYRDFGEIDGVKIRIVSQVHQTPTEEELASLQKAENSAVKDGCNCVIYVLSAYAPENMARTLAVITQTKTFLGWETDEFLEEHPEVSYAYMSMYFKDAGRGTGAKALEWKMPVYAYLTEVEEYRMFPKFKNREIGEFLASQFASPLDITEDEFLRLLQRRFGKKK
jgi:hypothetical protein